MEIRTDTVEDEDKVAEVDKVSFLLKKVAVVVEVEMEMEMVVVTKTYRT